MRFKNLQNGYDLKKVIFLFSIALLWMLVIYDILEDIEESRSLFHLILESFTICLGAYSIYGLIRDLRTELLSTNEALHTRERELSQLKQERGEWAEKSQHLIQGLATSIREQFNAWRLSQSEKEIALFLLKGLTTKEIAHIRDTSEITVRQQCSSIYAKSGLKGKSELSSFFLEDLLEV